MRNFLKIILVIWLSVGILGCSINDQEYEVKNNKEKSSNDNEIKHSFDVDLDEKSEEIVFSWYKKNHYEYEAKNEQKYSFQIVDKDANIYGKKCYLVVMYFDGSQYLNFAVNVKDSELYLCYEDNFTFIPINDIIMLNGSKYLKKIKKATIFLKKKCNNNNIIYCDTVMRLQKEYLVFAEYKNMKFQTMYFFDVKSKDVFTWDLKKDVLNAVTS